MDRVCKRCGNAIPEGEAFCSICSSAPAAPVKEIRKVLGIPDVHATSASHEMTGALVIAGEGVYLFIQRAEERSSLAHSLVGSVVDWAGGMAGGLAVKVAGGVASPSGAPPGCQPRNQFSAAYDPALHQAPDIIRCAWCLQVPRESIRRATFRGDGLLELATSQGTLELAADFVGRNAREFMLFRGFPVEQAGFAWGRALALTAALFLTGWATLREVSDLRQANDWALPRLTAALNRWFEEKPTVHHVNVRNGKKFYVVHDKEVPEEFLPWTFKAWHQYKEVLAFLFLGLLIAVFGLRSARERL